MLERRTRAICALMAQSMRRKVKTKDIWKISIRVVTAENTDAENHKVLLGVFICNAVLSALKLETLSKALPIDLLQFVCDAAKGAFLQIGLDPAYIDEARAYVIAQDFKCAFSGKAHKGPAGDRSARIRVVQAIDQSEVFLVIKKGKKEWASQIATGSPEEFQFQKYFGKVSWTSSDIDVIFADGTRVRIPLPEV